MPVTNREIAMILSLRDDASATLNQVNAKVKELNKEILNIERGTEDYRRHAEQLTTLRKAQADFNADVGRTPQAIAQVEAAWARLRPVIAATFSIAAGRQMVEASDEQELASARLSQALKTQGIAGDQVRVQMEEYSKSVQKVTVFSDEEVTRLQALLVSMTGLSGTALNPLTKATLDLATGMNLDTETAARLVARSEEGAEALKRMGITIGDTTSESERLAKVTGEIEKRFGGLAEALGSTDAGKVKEFRNQVNELEEAFGNIIKQAGGSLLPILGQLVGAIERAPTPVQTLTLTLGGLTAAALVLGVTLTPLTVTLGLVLAAVAALASAAGSAQSPVTRLTDEVKSLESEASSTNKLEDAARIYLELSSKANKSAAEHASLKKAITELSEAVPGSVTAFDAEGSAISLNADLIVKNIEARKALIQARLVDALDESAKGLAGFTKDALASSQTLAGLTEEQDRARAGSLSFGRTYADILNDITLASKELETNRSKIQDVANAFRAFVAASPGRSLEQLIEQLHQLGASGAAIDYVKTHWQELVKSVSDSPPKPKTEEIANSIDALQERVKNLRIEFERSDLTTDDALQKYRELKEATDALTIAQESMARAVKGVHLPSAFELSATIKLNTDVSETNKMIEDAKAVVARAFGSWKFPPPGMDEAQWSQYKEKIVDQAKLIADLDEKAFAEGKDRELHRIEVQEKKWVELAHGNEDLITQIHEAATRARSEISLKALVDEFEKWGTLSEQALQAVDQAFSRSSQVEISNLQKQLSDFQKNLEKRKTAELKNIDDRKKAEIAAIDTQLAHETLSAEERKKLEAQRFDTEQRYAALADAANAKYNAEESRRTDELNKKIADAKRRAAEQTKEASVIESIINTAVAVTKALPDIPLAIAVGALGAAETALIASQPIPEFHKGTGDETVADVLRAPPSEEFIVKLRGGETVRTESQEAEIQRAMKALPALPKFHEGGVIGGGELSDLSSFSDFLDRQARTDRIPVFELRAFARSINGGGRAAPSVNNYYSTQNNADHSDHSTRTIMIHVVGGANLKDDVKKAVQEGMRELGIDDVTAYFKNSRSHVTILP